MKAIDKFILHVVHNIFPLNEYSEGEINRLMAQFKEEADDLNININDDTLKTYIQRFDQIKNSPKIQEKDLRKYTLSQLIKLITSSAGAEAPDDEEDQTPDVVYQNDGKTIWNGSKEGNCILYGRGEKWCITRGSYGSYRYDASKGYPTFYLAKNNALSTNDALSFVAIQVRDVQDDSRKYVYTNRTNRPYESRPMSFNSLMSEVPWLNDIPNIRSILRYIPLSNQEKITQQYRNSSINIREWVKLPFNVKKQYLVVKKGNNTIFRDISNEAFISNILPKYPQIAEFIAITPGIISYMDLLANLDKFNNQDRRSITANLQSEITSDYLPTNTLPFDVKKLLTVLNKWKLKSDERLYVTKDGQAIVKLKFGEPIKVGIYTDEDDYPDIKLNQRTAKYLLDYPELDKIPFSSLLKLAVDGVVNKEFINKIIEKAKSDENSAIIVKQVEDGEILVDANTFSSYKIQGDKITKIPFANEEVQAALGEEKDNTSFQQGAVNIVKDAIENYEDIIPVDKDAFISIVNSTPYDKRSFTTTSTRGLQVLLVPDGESQYSLFTKETGDDGLYDFSAATEFGNDDDWRQRRSSQLMDGGAWRSYFAYLRNKNKVYEGSRLQQWFRSSYANNETKRGWFTAQPPLSPTDQYAIAVANGNYYVVNKANPRESLKLSDSGKLVKANIPSAMARQLLGATPDEATPVAAQAAGIAAAAGVRGRGRPAGQPNTPRAAVPAAPAAGGGDISIPTTMEETGLLLAFNMLPRADRNRLSVTNGLRVAPNGDRGAARRNNQLRTVGRVDRVISVGPSKIYLIRLFNNQQIIASINIQPGNRNYLLLPDDRMITLNSPAELLQALQQRNLAEVRNYVVREYLHNNPQHIDEVKSLLRKHIAETRN